MDQVEVRVTVAQVLPSTVVIRNVVHPRIPCFVSVLILTSKTVANRALNGFRRWVAFEVAPAVRPPQDLVLSYKVAIEEPKWAFEDSLMGSCAAMNVRNWEK